MQKKQSLKIIFFDLDKTLYPESFGIHTIMGVRIRQYLQKMGMSEEESAALSLKYYSDYGLAIRGLLLHHKDVNPKDYDDFVDGGLPLESILERDLLLREILEKIKLRKWIFTNAGIHHAVRTLNLLGIKDCFEGITYCDYSQLNFVCKPEIESFQKVMIDANVHEPSECVFIDDSILNINASKAFGWTTVFVNQSEEHPSGYIRENIDFEIKCIHEIFQVLPVDWFFDRSKDDEYQQEFDIGKRLCSCDNKGIISLTSASLFVNNDMIQKENNNDNFDHDNINKKLDIKISNLIENISN